GSGWPERQVGLHQGGDLAGVPASGRAGASPYSFHLLRRRSASGTPESLQLLPGALGISLALAGGADWWVDLPCGFSLGRPGLDDPPPPATCGDPLPAAQDRLQTSSAPQPLLAPPPQRGNSDAFPRTTTRKQFCRLRQRQPLLLQQDQIFVRQHDGPPFE